MRRRRDNPRQKLAILHAILFVARRLVGFAVKDAVMKLALTGMLAACGQLMQAEQPLITSQRTKRPVTSQTSSGR